MFSSESIDLTAEDEAKCKPEHYLQEDVVEQHIVDAFPVSAEKDFTFPSSSFDSFSSILGNDPNSLSNSSSGLRYKLLTDECEKQNLHLLEAQENMLRITSAIRFQQLKLNESMEITNSRLAKIEKLQEQLVKEKELYQNELNESQKIQQSIDELSYQLNTTERLANNLNENVIKKKVFMSQLQIQESKTNDKSPTEAIYNTLPGAIEQSLHNTTN